MAKLVPIDDHYIDPEKVAALSIYYMPDGTAEATLIHFSGGSILVDSEIESVAEFLQENME